ncbi:uncharacterized protein LACBIDRAFT_331721 [Laccaria bicolor S238N-H82]|uniref:Predicted protein n=1 Tax=Laccaria bicolor (strain S238N-H82 / ATCC MYA-4686) TaxID=486041 RepID=B0DQC6_LACBS|nr:uncharacterized protein LACBIDRAFT_331721 [Laccaria bicolor S238N-H82]EDR03359.1 predicted protein [Laccaria bicolor S238N-H82]|eukprot:XP_001886155.1 predicted protein [Laccaria bicolor S238N-H82]
MRDGNNDSPPLMATAHHYHHNGHECPPPTPTVIRTCHVDGNTKTPQRGMTTTTTIHAPPPSTNDWTEYLHNYHQPRLPTDRDKCPSPASPTQMTFTTMNNTTTTRDSVTDNATTTWAG